MAFTKNLKDMRSLIKVLESDKTMGADERQAHVDIMYEQIVETTMVINNIWRGAKAKAQPQ